MSTNDNLDDTRADAWTDEQRERIAAFNDADDTDPSHLAAESFRESTDTAAPITVKECERWRRDLRTIPQRCAYDIVREEGHTPETVRRHAYGRCQHPEFVVGEPADGHARKGGEGL